MVPPKVIGSTVTAQNWPHVSVTSRQSRSVRFHVGPLRGEIPPTAAAPAPRGNIAIFLVSSLASRSALSSLSSCVMTLDDSPVVGGLDWVVDEDGRDEREGRGDDVLHCQ